MIFLIPVLVAVLFVLGQFNKLHTLSREHVRSEENESIRNEILRLSAQNPRWIMMVTQTYSLVSIVLLIAKFLL